MAEQVILEEDYDENYEPTEEGKQKLDSHSQSHTVTLTVTAWDNPIVLLWFVLLCPFIQYNIIYYFD